MEGQDSKSYLASYAVVEYGIGQFAWFATLFDAEDFVKAQLAPHRYEIVTLTTGWHPSSL